SAPATSATPSCSPCSCAAAPRGTTWSPSPPACSPRPAPCNSSPTGPTRIFAVSRASARSRPCNWSPSWKSPSACSSRASAKTRSWTTPPPWPTTCARARSASPWKSSGCSASIAKTVCNAAWRSPPASPTARSSTLARFSAKPSARPPAPSPARTTTPPAIPRPAPPTCAPPASCARQPKPCKFPCSTTSSSAVPTTIRSASATTVSAKPACCSYLQNEHETDRARARRGDPLVEKVSLLRTRCGAARSSGRGPARLHFEGVRPALLQSRRRDGRGVFPRTSRGTAGHLLRTTADPLAVQGETIKAMNTRPHRIRPLSRFASILTAGMLLSLTPAPVYATQERNIPPGESHSGSLLALLETQESGWWDLSFARLLREQPQLSSARNAAGDTPLHVAARKRHETEVFLLLLAGADVNATDAQGRTPLHLVADQAREDAWMIRDMLAIKKARLDARDKTGMTPLMLAAKAGDVRTIEFLIWMGASLSAPADSVPSPRELALAAGHADAAALLVELPPEATVSIQSHPRAIPAYVARAFTDAAAQKDYALLTELMETGVGINTRDATGATALHRAVYRAHEDVVTFLLVLGADPNLADGNGNTPYMSASTWFGLSMDWMRAMLLLAGGETTGPVNNRGFSPLDIAVHHGNEGSAQLLIWAGANPTTQTGEAGTPMQIACRAGSQ